MSTKLSPEAVAARRAYRKAWRQAHPDKVKEYQVRYWNNVAEKAKQLEIEGATVTKKT